MTESSVSKYLDLINHQVTSQEHLSTFLSQAIAMLEVALAGDFSAFDAPTVHYYLLTMDDIVIRSRELNEQLLSNWIQLIRLWKEPEKSSGGGGGGGETIH